MKRPDEIKKGLSCHMTCNRSCKGCAYNDMPEYTNRPCTDSLCTDALAYIQQLEAENDRLREKIRVLELSLQAVSDGNATLQWENLMFEGQLPRWISVEESLPEARADGAVDAVLVTDGEFTHMAYYWRSQWIYCESGEMKEPMWNTVTHWMPLPSVPKEE